jgi:hypothetical protein
MDAWRAARDVIQWVARACTAPVINIRIACRSQNMIQKHPPRPLFSLAYGRS